MKRRLFFASLLGLLGIAKPKFYRYHLPWREYPQPLVTTWDTEEEWKITRETLQANRDAMLKL